MDWAFKVFACYPQNYVVWENYGATMLILPRDAALRLLRKRRLAYFLLGFKILIHRAFRCQVFDPVKFVELSFNLVKFWMLEKIMRSYRKMRETKPFDVKFLAERKLRFAMIGKLLSRGILFRGSFKITIFFGVNFSVKIFYRIFYRRNYRRI